MEYKFKGFFADKEGKQKMNAKEIRVKVEGAKNPEIRVKLSDLKDASKLMQKIKESSDGFTFYCKFGWFWLGWTIPKGYTFWETIIYILYL